MLEVELKPILFITPRSTSSTPTNQKTLSNNGTFSAKIAEIFPTVFPISSLVSIFQKCPETTWAPRPEEKAVEQEPQTTRKTIEVPEEYFVMVKVRAAKRRIREKDLWAEILRDYFAANPEG